MNSSNLFEDLIRRLGDVSNYRNIEKGIASTDASQRREIYSQDITLLSSTLSEIETLQNFDVLLTDISDSTPGLASNHRNSKFAKDDMLENFEKVTLKNISLEISTNENVPVDKDLSFSAREKAVNIDPLDR
jgi:hypothetical protein